MRFLWSTTLLTCKRLLRRPGMILTTLLLPLICGLAGLYLSGGGEALQIRVGVSVQEGDAFAQAVYDGLSRFDSPIIFELYTPQDADFLEREVAAGRMECAYLISPELGQSLRRGRARGGIVLLESPHTVMDMLAGEMILASLLREIAPQMNVELLVDVLELSPEQAEEIVAQKYAFYSERAEIFLQPIFHYQDAAGGPQAGSRPGFPAGARALHGVIALFLLAGVVWSLPGLIRETPGILRRLPPGPARAFMLGTGLAILLVGLMQGALGLLALAVTYPAALSGAFTGFVMLCAYLLCLSFLAGVVILLVKKCDGVYAGGSFVLLLTAVMGGVFIDLGEISPSLAGVSALFPSNHYIAGVLGGGVLPLVWLLTAALACACLTFFLAARRGR